MKINDDGVQEDVTKSRWLCFDQVSSLSYIFPYWSMTYVCHISFRPIKIINLLQRVQGASYLTSIKLKEMRTVDFRQQQ
jgi:hypothetical protein